MRPVSNNNLASAVAPPAPPAPASASKDKPAAQYPEYSVPPQTDASVTASSSVSSDYSHYNSKLTIDNFDLLKVSFSTLIGFGFVPAAEFLMLFTLSIYFDIIFHILFVGTRQGKLR
jgi:hypothetical protein